MSIVTQKTVVGTDNACEMTQEYGVDSSSNIHVQPIFQNGTSDYKYIVWLTVCIWLTSEIQFF